MINPSVILTLRRVGITVIPVKNKIPVVKGWRDKTIPLSEFTGDGLALVCGKASHNVEVIDIDNKSDRTDEILSALLRRCSRVVVNRTQHGGYHLIYRCSEVEGNKKLARVNGLTVVETRGEGGIIVIPPSLGYETLVGDIRDIPTISPSERRRLFDEAERFDEKPPVSYATTTPASGLGDGLGGSVKAQFNSLEGVSDAALQLLLSHGWKMLNGNRLRRPGKSWGHSATWGYLPYPYVLYVFSSNCGVFEGGHAYTPFDIFMKLEYMGEYSRAIDAVKNRRF